MKNKPRLLLAIITIIASFCFFGKNNAYADKQYLNLSYHKVRYEQENGKGTTIWYAVIPAKYKMHYAYANDTVWGGGGGEKPSENARRHGATIAVNSQLLGFPTIDGAIQYKGADVSGYDFSIEKNPNSVAEYDVFNIYANSITDPNNGISFYGVNLGFDYYGNYVQYNGKNMFMALYSQIVQDGTVLDFNNINSRASEYGTARHPRTWLTYDSQGNQYVAVAAGRNDGTDQLPQAGLSYEEIYDATRQFLTTDIYTLYNLDGGGSCGFIYKGTKISPNYDDNNTTERNVFGIFYWKVETQQVSFEKSSVTKTYGNANFTNVATTTGNGTITYESSNTNVATVNSSTGAVTIKKAGQATITATAAATDEYNSASASYTLTINKADRALTFSQSSVTKTYGSPNFTNAATKTGDGTITYSSSNDTIAEVNSETGAVTIKKAGQTTITATVAATTNYNAASASYTLTINKANGTVSFTNTQITKTYGDANFTNIATTTSDGAITYSSSDTGVAEVNSTTSEVTIKSAGETTITATVSATENYNSTSTSYVLIVNKHDAIVSFGNTQITKTYGDANFTNIATTISDGAITYSSSDTGVAEVNSTTGEVTVKSAGEATITATVAAAGNYDSASASYTLTVNKKTSQAPTEASELKNGYVTDRLSSISLSTPGLAWVNPEESIKEGSNLYIASYTEKNDTSNYTTEQFEITVLGERRKYTVIEGDKQTFTVSEDKTVTFKFDADYELFNDGGEIYIDDILVERKNYDAEPGSTIINFHYDFITTLTLREHTLTAIFNDGGMATANFALATEETDGPSVPNTGNNTSTGPELKPVCAVVTIIIISLFYLCRRKIQKEKDHVIFD